MDENIAELCKLSRLAHTKVDVLVIRKRGDVDQRLREKDAGGQVVAADVVEGDHHEHRPMRQALHQREQGAQHQEDIDQLDASTLAMVGGNVGDQVEARLEVRPPLQRTQLAPQKAPQLHQA